MYEKISIALINLLKVNSLIQSFYDFESSEIEGYPALTLTPAANENDYSTTTENRRIYAFIARIYVLRPSGKEKEGITEKTLRTLVDSVLDTIDKNHSSLNATAQTGYTFLFMKAAPSVWGYAGRENEMRVAEVQISVEYDIDTTLIT